MAASVFHAARSKSMNFVLKNAHKCVSCQTLHGRSLSSISTNYIQSFQDARWSAFQQNKLKSDSWIRYYSGPTPDQQNSSTAGKDSDESPDSGSDTKPEINEAEAKLAEEVHKLTEKATDLEDKYKRSLAETENVRQRMKKQIEDSRLFAIQGFCKDLLDVADVLQKATESVPSEELKKGNQHLKGLYDGLIMTEKELKRVFARNGLEKIEPIDEKFDPNFHDAIFYQPFPGKTPGTVAVVTKVGYKLHTRTVRPAIVGVVKEG